MARFSEKELEQSTYQCRGEIPLSDKNRQYDEVVVRLWSSGFSVSEIRKQTGYSVERIAKILNFDQDEYEAALDEAEAENKAPGQPYRGNGFNVKVFTNGNWN